MGAVTGGLAVWPCLPRAMARSEFRDADHVIDRVPHLI